MTDRDATREGSLTEQAYATLRARIVTCELSPGSTITERELARSTPYGLTPIRRALAQLDRDGLLITVPRSGYVVSPLDSQAVSELVEAWDLIGPRLVRLGLERMSDAEATELHSLLTQWSLPGPGSTHDGEQVLHFSEISMRVFELLAAASRNRWIKSSFDQLSAQMSRLWVTLLGSPDQPDQLRRLVEHWSRRFAGRSPQQVVDELPELIVESGRSARQLFDQITTGQTTQCPP